MDNDKIKCAINALYGVSARTPDKKYYDISHIDTDRVYKIIKNCCVCGNELSGRFKQHKVIKLHGNNRPVCDVCTRRLTRLAHMTYRSYRRGDTLD